MVNKPLTKKTGVVVKNYTVYIDDVHSAIEGLKSELAFARAADTYENPVSIVDKWFPVFVEENKQ